MQVEQIIDDAISFVEDTMKGDSDPIHSILLQSKTFVSTVMNPQVIKPLKVALDEKIESLQAEIAVIEKMLQKQAEAKAISAAKVMHEANVAQICDDRLLCYEPEDALLISSNDFEHDYDNSLLEKRKMLIAEMTEVKQLLKMFLKA